ncbi:hypothetical protein GUJ93_ZPchr0005g14285 [Zizania palustris]|uniref:Rrn7/TAF1B C-terminal cyclin domain-containing protein n=1 Tax=Zizania palustris TaxID=103762 RepID=A0A8J5S345_ZIZPA|nr:hypothetical protein GUJ93_ZPchr0005g14285 [Zizania palustris]
MDDHGGASPDPYGGGDSIHLVCEHCGHGSEYGPDDAEDGFFACRQCSAIHTSTQHTAADPYDLPIVGNLSVRRRATQPTPTPKAFTPKPFPTPHSAPAAASAFDEFGEPSEPRDFAPGAGVWGEPEYLGERIRWRYVRGLQVILQRQLEVLVERHRVGSLVCGLAGTIWLRWVAASEVFDEMWAQKVLDEMAERKAMDKAAAAESQKHSAGGDEQKNLDVKFELEVDTLPPKDQRRVEFFFLRSLRTMLPVWATEAKLPYMEVFTEVDRLLGSSVNDCPLDSRQLFRPTRVIGAWQLEAAAGSIAQKIGLCLPSVNFYSIAQRFLKELSLPIERILPYACRIYEWAMPAELWLSSNPARVPTRVSVMAIIIVALRILYGINGQGIWESIAHTGSAAAYDKIDVGHDYSVELRSYLKYCKDVVFTGITFSVEEEHLVDIFWDMYKGKEDENPKLCREDLKTSNGVNKRCRDGTFVDTNKNVNRAGKHAALSFVKRTIACCHNYEEAGPSCFDEPPSRTCLYQQLLTEATKIMLHKTMLQYQSQSKWLVHQMLLEQAVTFFFRCLISNGRDNNSAAARYEEPPNASNDDEMPDLSNLELPEMDVCFGTWLIIEDDEGLQDLDLMGLEIPMDDINEINLMI